MKLSEAMRLGAMLRPQFKGGSTDGKGTCALAAAADALGIRYAGITPYDYLEGLYPSLLREIQHPISRGYRPLEECIWTLNDSFGWSRERIADWVATIEAQQECALPQLDSTLVLPTIPVYEELKETVAKEKR